MIKCNDIHVCVCVCLCVCVFVRDAQQGPLDTAGLTQIDPSITKILTTTKTAPADHTTITAVNCLGQQEVLVSGEVVQQ